MQVVKGAPRYVYARSDSIHQGGIREWKGSHSFCISQPDIRPSFTANTNNYCALTNLDTAQFLRIIPTEERTAFVEPANFGKKSEDGRLAKIVI